MQYMQIDGASLSLARVNYMGYTQLSYGLLVIVLNDDCSRHCSRDQCQRGWFAIMVPSTQTPLGLPAEVRKDPPDRSWGVERLTGDRDVGRVASL